MLIECPRNSFYAWVVPGTEALTCSVAPAVPLNDGQRVSTGYLHVREKSQGSQVHAQAMGGIPRKGSHQEALRT